MSDDISTRRRELRIGLLTRQQKNRLRNRRRGEFRRKKREAQKAAREYGEAYVFIVDHCRGIE